MYTIQFKDTKVRTATLGIKIDSKNVYSIDGIDEIIVDESFSNFDAVIMKMDRKATPNQIDKELFAVNMNRPLYEWSKEEAKSLLFWTHFKRNGSHKRV